MPLGDWSIVLVPGQAHELAPSLQLLKRLPKAPAWTLADMACDAGFARPRERWCDPGRAVAQGHAGTAACPAYIYRHRNLIERCWSRLKERRAVATRYDKTAISYAAGIAIAATLDWLKYSR